MDREGQDARKQFRREAADAFGANLRLLRTNRGLSQESLSGMAGLTRTHVGLIETGARLPEIDTIYRLAGALGVEPGELLRGLYWRPGDNDGTDNATSEPPERPEDN